MVDVVLRAWQALDSRSIAILKLAVALSGAGVLGWGLRLRVRGRPEAHRRLRDASLAAIGVAAFACWWNVGRFHFPEYLQVHEHFHYYLGAKYFPELGYTRLYQCAAAADIEDGFGVDVARRWIRNLATNDLELGARLVPSARVCVQYFSPDRWASFTSDVRWFRRHSLPAFWDDLYTDHGYNPTPVWRLAAGWLAGLASPSDGQLLALALLDPALLLIMWAFVWWAFGWRAMCVALVWWGTNFPAGYYWTGGAFLRTDWLACSTIAICLAKRGYLFSSGFAATAAALLRIFPGLIIVGIVLDEIARMWRRRSLAVSGPRLRMALGGVAALVLLVGLTVVNETGTLSGAAAAWRAFAANSQKHVNTPATNNVGLRVLASYEVNTREANVRHLWVDAPWDTWTAARRRVFAEREPVFWAVVALFTAVLGKAVSGQPPWIAMILGAGLIPVAWDVSCYYLAVLLVFALLWTVHDWIGVAICLLSVASLAAAATFNQDDDTYAAISVCVLIFVAAVTAYFSLRASTASPSFETVVLE